MNHQKQNNAPLSVQDERQSMREKAQATERELDKTQEKPNRTETRSCHDCGGFDWTGHDCYRRYCIHNRHKYGNVTGAADLWPHG
jgi:hypothetical protein